MVSAFPPIDGGVVNAPPTDPNQPRSPTGISPPLGTAARSQATGTPVPQEPIQRSNQRANTHINPFSSAEDSTTGLGYGDGLGSSGRGVVDDRHASETEHVTGDGFGQQEPGRTGSDAIPFPQVHARHSGEGHEDDDEADVHLHRVSSSGPVSSHTHVVACTEDHSMDERTTGDKVKETASGVKGLVAAVHGVGEKVRGGFNAGVDRAFNDVCEPPKELLFPHLGVLDEWRCDEDGEGEVWKEERRQEEDVGLSTEREENVGETKNRNIANDGAQEVVSGNFSEGTKVREGVLPPAHLGAKGGKRID